MFQPILRVDRIFLEVYQRFCATDTHCSNLTNLGMTLYERHVYMIFGTEV